MISIIIPTILSRPKEYLERAIGSVVTQQWNVPIEILVYLNGPNLDFSTNFDVTVIANNRERLGLNESFNEALNFATYNKCIFLGDDDWFFRGSGSFYSRNVRHECLVIGRQVEMQSYYDHHVVSHKNYHITYEDFVRCKSTGRLPTCLSGIMFNKKDYLALGGLKTTGLIAEPGIDDVLWLSLAKKHGKVLISVDMIWGYYLTRTWIGNSLDVANGEIFSKVRSFALKLREEDELIYRHLLVILPGWLLRNSRVNYGMLRSHTIAFVVAIRLGVFTTFIKRLWRRYFF